ncbi:MAG: phospholipase D-like domain-containing protein, partial [Candidatus Bathyarchaeota archaeon]|nr:phospholipase D-like domain-containing protein [Candidatus Bathyarchaeota archaeon]
MATKPLLIGVMAGLLIGVILGYAITIPIISELNSRERAVILERNVLQNQLAQIHNTDSYITLALRDTQIAQLNQEIVEENAQIVKLQNQITSLKSSSVDLIAASFSRTDDTSSLIRNWIGKANSTIDVAIFSFTQDSIANALITAKGRGVNVRVFMESETINDSGSEYAR